MYDYSKILSAKKSPILKIKCFSPFQIISKQWCIDDQVVVLVKNKLGTLFLDNKCFESRRNIVSLFFQTKYCQWLRLDNPQKLTFVINFYFFTLTIGRVHLALKQSSWILNKMDTRVEFGF